MIFMITRRPHNRPLSSFLRLSEILHKCFSCQRLQANSTDILHHLLPLRQIDLVLVIEILTLNTFPKTD